MANTSSALIHKEPDMNKPNFIAIDVETTLKGNEDIGLAHPAHPDNRVVYFGLESDAGYNTELFAPDFSPPPFVFEKKNDFYAWFTSAVDKQTNFILCGQNIAFDLLYLYKEDPRIKTLIQSSRIWDTQLAEYLLTGQKEKFISLDQLCKKYGFPTKDSEVTLAFKAGHGADEIPKELITPYLQTDLTNTLAIAKMQYDKVVAQQMLPLVTSQMEALHATIEMRFNGMHVSKEKLATYATEVIKDFEANKNLLELCVKDKVEDIDSPKQWSIYFFGGTKTIKEKKIIGKYKNGKEKTKVVEKERVFIGHTAWRPKTSKTSKKTGIISVDDEVLSDMKDALFSSKANTYSINPKATIEILSLLLKHRTLSKQLNTYVLGLGKHVINSKIHPNINHTTTATGRLSSSNPNVQNISNNEIKKVFISRFHEGKIIEADFKQLEVVILAHITGDKQLIADLSGGVDIHSALYEGLFGVKPTKELRKPFKARTFQLIYGASAKAISEQAKCSLEEAEKFVSVFYTRYPEVRNWHTNFRFKMVHEANHLFNEETDSLNLFKTSIFKAETGRRLIFNEYPSSYTKDYTLSPTEMKNYPVQSLATGDIVPMMLGVLFDILKGNPHIKLINTVHDSILLDVNKNYVNEAVILLKSVLSATHLFYEKTFKKELALKLEAGISVGDNWFDMKEL